MSRPAMFPSKVVSSPTPNRDDFIELWGVGWGADNAIPNSCRIHHILHQLMVVRADVVHADEAQLNS